MDIIDIRRFFRNRVSYYAALKDSHCVGVEDECRLTLKDLCRLLEDDDEPMALWYEPDLRKICGRDYRNWCHKERTYGHAARLIARLLAVEDGSKPPVTDGWVQEVLSSV